MEERKFYVDNYEELCRLEEQVDNLFNKMISLSIKQTDSSLDAYGTYLSNAWSNLYDARKVAESKMRFDKKVKYSEL